MRTTPLRLARAGAPLAAAALLFAMSSPAGAQPGGERPAPRSDAPAVTDDGSTAPAEGDVADEGDNAHPSGRDRSVEPGGSGTQGKATSEPDQDGKGPERHTPTGADKPGDTGGVDPDRDGNNGCGNDDDFDDDNEGNCLGREGAPGQQDRTPPTPPADDDDDVKSDDEDVKSGVEDDDEDEIEKTPVTVEGDVPGGPAAPAVGDVATDDTQVLGISVTNDVAPAAETEVLGATVTRSLGALAADGEVAGTSTGQLPRTGAALLGLALFGAALAGIGVVVSRLGKADAGA